MNLSSEEQDNLHVKFIYQKRSYTQEIYRQHLQLISIFLTDLSVKKKNNSYLYT